MREFCPVCRGDWLQITSTPEGAFGCWRDVGRPGFAGRQVAAKRDALDRQYGPGNWRIVYRWRGATVTREQALQTYTDAYEAHLAKHPDVLDWLVKTASDVYDISPTDVESGTDFTIQQEHATHLQDIAVRIAVQRLGRQFEGTKLIQIRGKQSAGSQLSPGVVPFHEPDEIVKPELKGWWKPSTIESFWQSNKCMEIREWKSRIFVFGGSFNPIHNGHLDLARHARDNWGFDQIIFVPNGDNYRKTTLTGTSAKIRLDMVRAAIDGEVAMEVLDVEVLDDTPMRTPVTMKELSDRYPDTQLALFRGLDALHRVHRDCFALPSFIVLTVGRKGFNLTLDQVLSRHKKFDHVRNRIIYAGDDIVDELSSSQVREAIREGKSIGDMVPENVERIISGQGLYRC